MATFFRGAFCSAELAVNHVGICEKSIACKKCPGYISNFFSSMPKKLLKIALNDVFFPNVKKGTNTAHEFDKSDGSIHLFLYIRPI